MALSEDISQLKVDIAASGRFHLLDLARELDALGIDVRFYSYVPRRRAMALGLPPHCHVSFLPYIFPLVGMERIFPRILPSIIERLMCWALDVLVIMRMRRCDLFICMSGMYVQAPRFAKWRYGAKIILHRASQHVLSQRQILAQITGAQQVTQFMVQRELRGYDLADQIAVPSSHVVESFTRWPCHASKLYRNPYGVDIDRFPFRDVAETQTTPTVLYVGHWSYRKGADLLTEAITAMEGVRLLHVGPVVDVPFPADWRFKHYEPVPQERLRAFYEAADIFVLPSREDGFGYVLSQALASGLPVVCTDRTGGPDLAVLPGFSRLIRVAAAGDAEALRKALMQSLEEGRGTAKFVPITQAEREMLSWKCYATRELQFMRVTPKKLSEHIGLSLTA